MVVAASWNGRGGRLIRDEWRANAVAYREVGEENPLQSARDLRLWLSSGLWDKSLTCPWVFRPHSRLKTRRASVEKPEIVGSRPRWWSLRGSVRATGINSPNPCVQGPTHEELRLKYRSYCCFKLSSHFARTGHYRGQIWWWTRKAFYHSIIKYTTQHNNMMIYWYFYLTKRNWSTFWYI